MGPPSYSYRGQNPLAPRPPPSTSTVSCKKDAKLVWRWGDFLRLSVLHDEMRIRDHVSPSARGRRAQGTLEQEMELPN